MKAHARVSLSSGGAAAAALPGLRTGAQRLYQLKGEVTTACIYYKPATSVHV